MSKIARINSIARKLLVFLILVLAVYSFITGDWSTLRSFAIGGAIGLAIFFLVYPLKLKRLLLNAFSTFSHRPAHPDDFPRLDVPTLEKITTEWESLGFVRCADFEGRASNPAVATAFSRLLVHEREGAIVEVSQQFLPTKTLPLNSLVQSFWGEREQVLRLQNERDRNAATIAPIPSPISSSTQPAERPHEELDIWALLTHNHAPNRYFRVLSHPRVLGERLEATANPAQMWQLHQQRATLVEARLGTPSLRGDLPLLLRAHGRAINDIFVRRLQATPAWTLARYSLTRKPTPQFYDGELAPLGP